MSVSDQRAHVTCVDVSNVNKQIFRRRRKHTPIIAEAQCTYWPIKPAIHSDNQNCTKTVSSCHSRHVTVDGITTYQSLHCWTSTHQPPATFTLPIVTTAGRAHTSLPLHSLSPSQLLLDKHTPASHYIHSAHHNYCYSATHIPALFAEVCH